MGRQVGGGIGMGKTCEPKAFSFQCMTKFTTKQTNKQTNKKNCVCSLLLIFLMRQPQELREISCTYIKIRQLISPVQDQRVQPHLSLFRILVVFSNNEKPGKIIEEMCAYFS